MKIEKVRKNAEGDITDVMINGNVYNVHEAMLIARGGQLEGVHVGRAKNGREYLRSNPDDRTANNLDQLPTFQ